MNYCPDSIECLKSIIEQYSAVSFDIWDTLITRMVLEPEDVFSIVENRARDMKLKILDFRKHRHEAVFQVTRANPNISEIYNALQAATGISDKEKETLMYLEIQVESEVIFPRKEMIEILEYAIETGKQVNLITDMYLPENIMKKFLQQAGVLKYDHLFVSCDYRQLKQETLFSIYKEKVRSDTYLHIGDNPRSDISSAQKWGIDTVLVKSGYRLLEESVFSKICREAQSHNARCMVGLFCARIFNNPFIEVERIKISNCEDMGWLFIAPLISVFMHWLKKEMIKGDYSGILFVSRDGFLPWKLYLQMQREIKGDDLPESTYFLTSRALCTLAGIESNEDIEWLATIKFNGSEQDLLKYRFCLENKDILPMHVLGVNNIKEYVMLHREKIVNRVSELRKNYMAYMDKIGIKTEKKYAIFDFVSSGTCQYYLTRFISYVIEGKYFCRSITNDGRAGLQIDSLYVNEGLEKADSILFENYRRLETIMTSLAPALRYIDKDLNAIYDEETRSDEELRFIAAIHKAIEEYFKYYIVMCDWQADVDMSMAEDLYQYMNDDNIEIICKTLDSMQLRDDWVREFVEK